LAGFKVNIFRIATLVLSLLLVGYLWLVFLPTFRGAIEYQGIQNVVILITVLLLVASGIQVILSIRKEESEQE